MKKLFAMTIMVFGIITLISCEKETSNYFDNTTSNIGNESKLIPPIPYYESIEAIDAIVDYAASIDSLPQLVQYEINSGRVSGGRVADEFYEGINPQDFASQDEILDFYANNTIYLDTLMNGNEITILPKFYNNPYRYAANEAGLFNIKGTIHRIFKSGIVSTDSAHYETLMSLQENDINTLDTTIYCYSRKAENSIHSNCTDEWYWAGYQRVGNYAFHMKLNTQILQCGGNRCNRTSLTTSTTHKFIVWWAEKHTMSVNGYMTYHNATSAYTWFTGYEPVSQTQKRRVMTVNICGADCIVGCGADYYHYSNFDLIGNTPGIPAIHFYN